MIFEIVVSVVGFLLGMLGMHLVISRGSVGTLKIDHSKPKDIYRFEFDKDVRSFSNKSIVIFKVDNNADLTSVDSHE